MLSDYESEACYSLEDDDNSKLAHFFKHFKLDQMGIESIGLNMTTLEQVYLAVGEMVAEESRDHSDTVSLVTLPDHFHLSGAGSDDHSVNDLLEEHVRYTHWLARWAARVWALVVKRLHFSRRYWPSLVFQILVPGIVFILLLYLDHHMKHTKQDDPHLLPLDLGAIYGPTIGLSKVRPEDNQTKSELRTFYDRVASDVQVNVTSLPWDVDFDDYLGSAAGNVSIQEFASTYLSGVRVEVDNQTAKSHVTAWNILYNNEALHSAAGATNLFYAARQLQVLNETENTNVNATSDPILMAANHPFPSEREYLAVLFLTRALNLVWSVAVPGESRELRKILLN